MTVEADQGLKFPFVRVMTWNLWWKFGPWEARQTPIEVELANIDADIVLLQEIYADDDEDQATRLGQITGKHVARTTGPDGSAHAFGNAILSRWEIRTSRTVRLPNPDGQPGHRSALFAEIETPAGIQLVVCTHLEWRYDQSATRSAQLQLICDEVKVWIDSAAAENGGEANGDSVATAVLPPILGGDFNAVVEADEIRKLTGLAEPYTEGLIFTDSWAATNDQDGYTWTRQNPHSCDAQWPNRRLDYVFSAWPRRKPQMNPLRTELVGVTAYEGVVPSDHYGVLATFDDRMPFEDGR